MHEAQHESGHGLIELLWVANGILHHVNTVSCIGHALPMEHQHCEEETEVDSQRILVSEIELFSCHDCQDEGHLNHEKEQSSVEDVDLIANFQLELVFVGFHESVEADCVHVGRHLHCLGLLLIGFGG